MAGTKFFRNLAILAKLESTYGIDPTPTGAANAVLGVDVELTPFEAEEAKRNDTRPYMGARQSLYYGKRQRLRFKVEMAGHGQATPTAPAWAAIMRACGMAQTANTSAAGTISATKKASGTPVGTFTHAATVAYAGNRRRTVTLACTTGGGSGVAQFHVTAPAAGNQAAYDQAGVVMTNATPFALGGSATITPTIGTSFTVGDTWTIDVYPPRYSYTPVSSGFESATFYYYLDGLLHKLLGARGTVGWEVQNGIPYLTFDFVGLYQAPTDQALPSVTLTAWQAPLVAEIANTVVFTLHGIASPLQSLNAAANNDVGAVIRVNQERVLIGDREWKGQAVIEMDDIATYDWFAATANGTLLPLALQHGNAVGQIVRIDAAQAQVKVNGYSRGTKHEVLAQLDFMLIPTAAGNDEIEISVV